MMKISKSKIIIGGNTAAIRAQKLLRQSGIPSKTIRIIGNGERGCAYGIETDEERVRDAIFVLRRSKIPYSFI